MSDDLERLQRWVDSGAIVRILTEHDGLLTVGMLTCDGGTEMGRVVTSDPGVVEWCRGVDS